MHSLVSLQVVDGDETAATFFTLEISLVLWLMNPEAFSGGEASSTLLTAVGVFSVTTLVVDETCQFGEAFPTFTTPVVAVAV